jgi:hypothetical protein
MGNQSFWEDILSYGSDPNPWFAVVVLWLCFDLNVIYFMAQVGLPGYGQDNFWYHFRKLLFLIKY